MNVNIDFEINNDQIGEIFRIYFQRRSKEEIDYINSKYNGIEGLAKKLKTDLNLGISSNNIKSRLQVFDNNTYYKKPSPSFLYYVKKSLINQNILNMIITSIIYIIIGMTSLSQNPGYDAIEGTVIIIIIFIIIIINSISYYNLNNSIIKTNNEKNKVFKVLVKRDGIKTIISSEDLLVGDICKIDIGTKIPADGIIISSSNIKINESSITGISNLNIKESIENCHLIKTSDNKEIYTTPILLSGTEVKDGEGWMLILATGSNSIAGKIHLLNILNEGNGIENEQTPLELKLTDILEVIIKYVIESSRAIAFVLLFWLIYSKVSQMYYKNEILENYKNIKYNYNAINNYSIWSGIVKDLIQIHILISAIIYLVNSGKTSLIPKIFFWINLKKDDNFLFMHRYACETMPGINYMCMDKTGILTKNEMNVVSIFNNENKIEINSTERNHTKIFSDNYYNILIDAIINNIDIELDENNKIIINNSSKTDIAFYHFLKQVNENIVKKYQQLYIIKNNSNRKRMSTIVKTNDEKYFIYTKGNPEIIIKSCSSYLKPNGIDIIKINNDNNSEYINILNKVIDEYSNLGFRKIAIAMKEISLEEFNNFIESKNNDSNSNEYEIEKAGFNLIGIAAINDNLRPGVAQSIDIIHNSGIKVIMLTSDDIKTAEYYAKKTGIIRYGENYLSLNGEEFIERIGGIVCKNCTMEIKRCTCPTTITEARSCYYGETDEYLFRRLRRERVHDMGAFSEIIKNLKIIANIDDFCKKALIYGLRELDKFVAIAGDNADDIAALSKSDLAIVMGKTGKDVVKNVADVIILDDNINSIIKYIKLGKNLYENIRKYLTFFISINFSIILILYISSLFLGESPFASIQIIWILFIINSFVFISFITEGGNDDTLNQRPISKKEYLINNTMWKMILVQTFIPLILILFIYFFGANFIIENNPERIDIIKNLNNCFDKFMPETSLANEDIYYIMDGKKYFWDYKKFIKNNSDINSCFFMDNTKFKQNQINNLNDAYNWYNSVYGNTAHMTIVFNTFVFYILFNQINCRIINNNLNIFKGFFKNKIFILLYSIEILLQILIVQYGGLFFKCNKLGLTLSQWEWCICLASITFVVNFISKLFNFENILEKHFYAQNNHDEGLLNDENYDEFNLD